MRVENIRRRQKSRMNFRNFPSFHFSAKHIPWVMIFENEHFLRFAFDSLGRQITSSYFETCVRHGKYRRRFVLYRIFWNFFLFFDWQFRFFYSLKTFFLLITLIFHISRWHKRKTSIDFNTWMRFFDKVTRQNFHVEVWILGQSLKEEFHIILIIYYSSLVVGSKQLLQ